METRLTPEQLRGVSLVQDIARAQDMNVYLTGGAVRDLISGLPIRDLDFTIQGNPLKLQRELERVGARVQGVDDDLKIVYVLLPGNVRAEIDMARSETFDKPGKLPSIAPATITDDLRRRDFTINAMALSLNPGSRGLLMDPSNGVADIEAKLIRILHNYAFYEEPSRLIRAARYSARFHWPLEERTQARYDAAKENDYISYIGARAIGIEIEQLAYEDDPLHIMRSLEKEDWLKVLNSHWAVAKVDTAGLTQLTKLKQQMAEFGYIADTAPAVLYFLTRRLSDKDVAEIRKLIPRRDLVDGWKRLDEEAKDLAKKLGGKEAATPSRTWQLLSNAKPETILFAELTTKQQAVSQKIGNFFGKWRQLKQKLPLPEMTELHITPALPEYPKVTEEAFMLLLDGKLRSRSEILKFLKPYAPPPPPPPPPPKRGKGAKVEATVEAAPKGRKKGKGKAEPVVAVAVVAPPAPAPKAAAPKAAEKPSAKHAPVPAKKAAKAVPAKPAAAAKKTAKAAKAPAKKAVKKAPAKKQPAPKKKAAPAKPAKKMKKK
jgi:tRNA nucleotidyltransferase/poly(A) polymerase